MTNPSGDLADKFRFVEPSIAREQSIYEILDEIYLFQQQVVKNKSGNLISYDDLYASRNIKIPFNNLRQKNINYLIELLMKNYPDHIKTIISFDFNIEPETKKFTINEKKEFTVSLKDEQIREIKAERDMKSVKSLTEILIRFRLFNLSKLINRAKNRDALKEIIAYETGKSIFVFKNHELGDKNYINTEDYCFHLKNYDAVRRKLNPDNLKGIINAHLEAILRRLKKFGILNTDFTDYRESKLDYILNIILQEIQSSLSEKELVEIKNFDSLRKCLIDMEKVIDPAIMLGSDIQSYIESSGICKESDIISIFHSMTPESLGKWAEENMDKNRIFSFKDGNSEAMYIDGKIYLDKITELYNLIFLDREKYSKLGYNERRDYYNLMEMLSKIGRYLFKSDARMKTILADDEGKKRLKSILDNYDLARKKSGEKEAVSEKEPPVYFETEKKSIIRRILDFILSIFTGGKAEEFKVNPAKLDESAVSSKFSRETKNFYNEIRLLNSPIIPLSDYIQIIPDNEPVIEKIISELRGNNLKTVIPIYNARANLYPKRSQKLLMADVEYLLVDPNLVNDADTIREFTENMAGFKLKEDVIPPSAMMTIEKYLLNINRQKKARKKP